MSAHIIKQIFKIRVIVNNNNNINWTYYYYNAYHVLTDVKFIAIGTAITSYSSSVFLFWPT